MPGPLNPDCRDNKCHACAGDAWCETTDAPDFCHCHCHDTPTTR